jgi:hypothetical protein
MEPWFACVLVAASGGSGGSGTPYLELIEEQVLPSDATSVTFSAIPARYDHLLIRIEGIETDRTGALDSMEIQVGIGSVDSGSNYGIAGRASGSNNANFEGSDATKWSLTGSLGRWIPSSTADAGQKAWGEAWIYDYTKSGNRHMQFWGVSNPTTGAAQHIDGGGTWDTAETDPIDIIVLTPDEGTNFLADSKFALYGVTINAAGPSGTFSPILDRKPTTDTPDDEFDSSTLDGKWTEVDGVTGTVDVIGKPVTDAIYDLSSRPSWLLIQGVGSNGVDLRQDYTLPDGKSLVVGFAPALAANSGTEDDWINNEMRFAFSVNDDDAAHADGNFARIQFEVEANSYRWFGSETGAVAVGHLSRSSGFSLGALMYMRIARDGGDYHLFVTQDGSTWVPLGTATPGATADNIWIHMEAVSQPVPAPIFAIPWIRLGTNDIDPW